MSTNVSTIARNSNPSTSTVSNTSSNKVDANFLKLAVVVDVILDDNHPFFGKTTSNKNSKPPPTVRYQQIPVNYDNKIPVATDIDFSYIGRIKIRILSEEIQTDYEKLQWAIPLDNTITQFPLLNEQVLVLKIGDNYYYTKPFNRLNFLGTNGEFLPYLCRIHRITNFLGSTFYRLSDIFLTWYIIYTICTVCNDKILKDFLSLSLAIIKNIFTVSKTCKLRDLLFLSSSMTASRTMSS